MVCLVNVLKRLLCILIGVIRYLSVDFICIFLMTNKVYHFLMYCGDITSEESYLLKRGTKVGEGLCEGSSGEGEAVIRMQSE